jgi:hypothetical protein
MGADDMVWYRCRGAGQRICMFCQRHTSFPAVSDGWAREEHDAPRGARRDQCPEFILRADLPSPLPC